MPSADPPHMPSVMPVALPFGIPDVAAECTVSCGEPQQSMCANHNYSMLALQLHVWPCHPNNSQRGRGGE